MSESISRFFQRYFAYLTLAFALLGYYFPNAFKFFIPWINMTLGLIMFGMGLTLSVKDFKSVLIKPFQVAVGVIAQFVIMPLVAVVLVNTFNLDPMVAVGVILVGCCPGGTSSNVITYLAKGDVALSVTITSITTLLAPVVTPFLLWVFASSYIDISISTLLIAILKIVVLPIILGVFINQFFQPISRQSQPWLPVISVLGIIMIVAAVVGINQQKISEMALILVIVVILHNLLGYALGYVLAKMLKMNSAQQKTISIEVGMQNSGLGASLATSYFDPLAAVPAALFSVWHNISGAILANFFKNKP